MSAERHGDTPTFDTVSSHLHGRLHEGVLTLELANEGRRNALSLSMLAGLERACAEIASRSDVRVAVITGAGDAAFAAGADLGAISSDAAGAVAAPEYDEQYARTVGALRELTIPLIARIRGVCVGGGLTVAMTADLRVADTSATFAIPAARIGLAYRHVEPLVAAIGAENASDLLLTGRGISAREALAMRLISRVTDPEQLDDVVAELAATIARNAPLSLVAGKLAIRSAVAGRPPALEAQVDELVERCRRSVDHQEGLAALRARRPAAFQGH